MFNHSSFEKIQEKLAELQTLMTEQTITYESKGIKVLISNNKIQHLYFENHISSEQIAVSINEGFELLAESAIQMIEDFISKQDKITQLILRQSFKPDPQ